MLTFDKIQFERPDFKIDAHFHVEDGERIVLMGASGCGKSTLLSLMAGFETPTQGRVLHKGEDITLRAPRMRPLTMLFQDNNLFPHLTASANVGLGLGSLRLNTQDLMKVEESLEIVGALTLKDRLPAQLSGGESQRVALARSLLMQHKLLLLDEPFAALGPGVRQELLSLLLSLQKERSLTIVMATHSPEDACLFGGRLLFMEGGSLVVDDTLPQALHSPSNPTLVKYLGRG